MGPMGEKERQLALGTTAGRKFELGRNSVWLLGPRRAEDNSRGCLSIYWVWRCFLVVGCAGGFSFGGLELLPGRACVV